MHKGGMPSTVGKGLYKLQVQVLHEVSLRACTQQLPCKSQAEIVLRHRWKKSVGQLPAGARRWNEAVPGRGWGRGCLAGGGGAALPWFWYPGGPLRPADPAEGTSEGGL